MYPPESIGVHRFPPSVAVLFCCTPGARRRRVAEVPASTTSLSGMPVDAPMSVTLGLAWVCLSASVRRSRLLSLAVVTQLVTRSPDLRRWLRSHGLQLPSIEVRRSVLISVPVTVLRCCTRGPWPRPRRLSTGSPNPHERDVGERISVAPPTRRCSG